MRSSSTTAAWLSSRHFSCGSMPPRPSRVSRGTARSKRQRVASASRARGASVAVAWRPRGETAALSAHRRMPPVVCTASSRPNPTTTHLQAAQHAAATRQGPGKAAGHRCKTRRGPGCTYPPLLQSCHLGLQLGRLGRHDVRFALGRGGAGARLEVLGRVSWQGGDNPGTTVVRSSRKERVCAEDRAEKAGQW